MTTSAVIVIAALVLLIAVFLVGLGILAIADRVPVIHRALEAALPEEPWWVE